jgi:hypothetical protein
MQVQALLDFSCSWLLFCVRFPLAAQSSALLLGFAAVCLFTVGLSCCIMRKTVKKGALCAERLLVDRRKATARHLYGVFTLSQIVLPGLLEVVEVQACRFPHSAMPVQSPPCRADAAIAGESSLSGSRDPAQWKPPVSGAAILESIVVLCIRESPHTPI